MKKYQNSGREARPRGRKLRRTARASAAPKPITRYPVTLSNCIGRAWGVAPGTGPWSARRPADERAQVRAGVLALGEVVVLATQGIRFGGQGEEMLPAAGAGLPGVDRERAVRPAGTCFDDLAPVLTPVVHCGVAVS